MKAKELKDKIKPEDYKPESNRAANDEEYEKQQKELEAAGIVDQINFHPTNNIEME